MKKRIGILLVLVLVLSLSISSFAGEDRYSEHFNNLKIKYSEESAQGIVPAEIAHRHVDPAARQLISTLPPIIYPDYPDLVSYRFSSKDLDPGAEAAVCPFCGEGSLYLNKAVVHGPFRTGDQVICEDHIFGVDLKMYTISILYYGCTQCSEKSATTSYEYFWACHGFE